MKPSLGSVLHYAPDPRGWMAQLSDAEQTLMWAEPVIGWAVVVVWTGYESSDPKDRAERPDHFETELQPVIFDGSHARTPTQLGEDTQFVRLIMPGFLPPPISAAAPDGADTTTDEEKE